MYKKLIAMIMVFAMLVSISPAVAAEDAPAKPTVEEILNEYHQKSFETQNAQERSTASANSRSTSGSSQTPEQEAIEQLHEAGYEAYNVTAENYNALESTLMCDFEDLGLDPNGSYIVVIHGEDENNNEGNPNSRTIDDPTQDIFDQGGGGSSYFTYTYQDKTYYMRYVTVTSTDSTALRQAGPVVTMMEGNPDNLTLGALNPILSIISLHPKFSTYATLVSLLLSMVPDPDYTAPTLLTYTPTSLWTITYTQVYDFQNETWKSCASVEYALPQFFVNCCYVDPYTERFEQATSPGEMEIIYSDYYNDTEYIKQQAALAFEYNTCSLDTIETITYKHNDEVVATHYHPLADTHYAPLV